MSEMPNILQKILRHKAQEVAERARHVPLPRLCRQAEEAPPVREFMEALVQTTQQDRPAVIAEIKQASPSKGLLRQDFDPATLARSYEAGGAACLSVLTDRHFFRGSETHLRQARAACRLPVLRKDFIVDPYQVYEARAAGADCILLIAATLEESRMGELARLANSLNMDTLAEVHNAMELERVLRLDAPLIGINNRDLKSFKTRLETTLDLLPRIPGNGIVITESGIHAPADVERMRQAGINAFLVGEAFMKAEQPGAELAKLFGMPW